MQASKSGYEPKKKERLLTQKLLVLALRRARCRSEGKSHQPKEISQKSNLSPAHHPKYAQEENKEI
jgi:hypothetical protein